MKTAFVALAALAALAQAQTRADIPSCALPCLDAAITANTKCSTTDFVCVCKDFNAVQADATSCVIEKCGADVAISKVLPATQALCAANAGGAGSGSSAANTTPAKETTSAAQTTPAKETTSAAQTSAAQTSAAETSSVASSVASSVSSVVSSAPVSSAPAQTTPAGTGIVTTTTPAGTGATGNRTTTSHTSAPTNAGSALLPGLAMLALGALAL